jgi:hypothetical protein
VDERDQVFITVAKFPFFCTSLTFFAKCDATNGPLRSERLIF